MIHLFRVPCYTISYFSGPFLCPRFGGYDVNSQIAITSIYVRGNIKLVISLGPRISKHDLKYGLYVV